MSKNKELIVKMTYLAVLTALVVILQTTGIAIKLPFLATPVSLVLVPIVLGACLLGVRAGAFLGFVFGLIVTITCCFMGMDPTFTGILFQEHPVITVLLCLSKSTLAGLVSGLVYKPFKDKNEGMRVVGTFVAAAAAPIVNTGTFIIGCLIMSDTFNANFTGGQNIFYVLFIVIAGFNFLFEFALNMILAPTISFVVRVVEKQVTKPKVNKQNLRYKVALFDMDGTLVNTFEGVKNSLIYAFEKLGDPVQDNLQRFIGPPLTQSFKEFCGYDEEKMNLAIEYYREYYAKQGIDECQLYDGIKELLRDLKNAGVKIYLATSKPDIFAHRLAHNFEISPYFDYFACASADEKTRTTKEQVMALAMEQLEGYDKKDIVMIGDRHFDINGAKAFGISSIGVTFGFGSEEELRETGATHIAHNTEEIKSIVLA
ncbi:MAG: HAD hydrolase-like protein [Clostridia bacterium]|nr:HAD hydrolase-like protein [Clostridia bacterium]MBQ8146781.1 HAD hydrolase-like protein [Clostridia bacterium]